MAIISTFELLIKRIGPPSGPSLPSFRKLLQGYYLTIANPNNRNVKLVMRAVVPKRSDNTFSAQQRELVGGSSSNHVYAYDRTGSSTTPSAAPRELLGAMLPYTNTSSSLSFQTAIASLQPFQTGLFNLVPKPELVLQNNPQLEIRGYIQILQLGTLIFDRRRPPFTGLEYITPDPVDLIFTPEIRGTFIDDNLSFPVVADTTYDFDQSNYALPTLTGAAKITVSDFYNPFVIPAPPFPPVGGPIGILGSIDPKKLTGGTNFLGEYVLDDKALKYIAKTMKKKSITDMTVKDAKIQLETLINQLKVD